MSGLPSELRDLIESGPMAHLSTINADGSPQVSVIWVGLDGDDLVSGQCSGTRSCATSSETRGSCCPSRRHGSPAFLEPVRRAARAGGHRAGRRGMEPADRLTKVYVSPETDFPAPKGPGYLVRYSVERIGGVGPWASASH